MTTEDQIADDAPPVGWARLTNMELALRTMLDAQHAEEGAPRLALFYGPSGYGKTVASAYTAAQTGAAYLLARSVWTHRSFLEALAAELGIVSRERTATRLMDQIIDRLLVDPRPLLIDEMDHLVKKLIVEVIRDISDATDVPIMMVGMEGLPAALKEWEQFHNRIIAATAAQPADRADGRLLRDLYVRKIEIKDDLVDYFTHACHGVTRRIVVNLQRAQRVAIDEMGKTVLDRAIWGNRPVATGDIVTRRQRALAA